MVDRVGVGMSGCPFCGTPRRRRDRGTGGPGSPGGAGAEKPEPGEPGDKSIGVGALRAGLKKNDFPGIVAFIPCKTL